MSSQRYSFTKPSRRERKNAREIRCRCQRSKAAARTSGDIQILKIMPTVVWISMKPKGKRYARSAKGNFVVLVKVKVSPGFWLRRGHVMADRTGTGDNLGAAELSDMPFAESRIFRSLLSYRFHHGAIPCKTRRCGDRLDAHCVDQCVFMFLYI